MVKIRLNRLGRKKAPFYRIVAVDSRNKSGGIVLETLGSWNPIKKALDLNKEKLENWIKKGAQVSATVSKLIK